jgi:hypothetical protein
MNIGGRAISSLLQTQGIGDLFRIYATAARDGVDFNLGLIPPTFTTGHLEDFDQTTARTVRRRLRSSCPRFRVDEGPSELRSDWLKSLPDTFSRS